LTNDIPQWLADLQAGHFVDKRVRQIQIGIAIAVIGVISLVAGWWLYSQTSWASYPYVFMYRPDEDSGVLLMLLGAIGIIIGFFVAYLNRKKPV